MTIPDWDEYYLSIAQMASQRSKDPSTKVGAVLVNVNNQLISTGYNGFPQGCNETMMTFDRPMKYHLTIHAEMNALLFANESLKDSSAYITHPPCDNCLKHLIQAGVKRIVYKKDDKLMKRMLTQEQRDAINVLVKSTGTLIKEVE